MRVLDHGAGMSTIWWARRVEFVYAIEADTEWYNRVKRKLASMKLTNATVELRGGDSYSDLSDIPDESFDFIAVDGHAREVVMRHAIRIVKRPGFIYLDNTDFADVWHHMYGEAEEILTEAARREGAAIQYFTGLAPATVVASQGMLVRFAGPCQEQPGHWSTGTVTEGTMVVRPTG
jgi:predicted O-methyltransferase YrrM